MARMPKGARVWQVIMVTDDVHASAKLEVGDSSDPNRFITESIDEQINFGLITDGVADEVNFGNL